jgi:hypothetical protein
MCIDEKTSLNTFVIGTLINFAAIINIFTAKIQQSEKIKYISVILVWQYVLFMQIPDWLAWRHMRLHPNEKIPKSYGILASILNYTQPLIILIALLVIKKYTSSGLPLLYGIIALLIYSGFVIYSLYTRHIDFSLKPSGPNCSLSYNWWTTIQVLFYLITCTLLLLLLPSKLLTITNLAIFWGSFFISMLISYLRTKSINNVGFGSLWCWSVGFAGLAVWIVYFIKSRKQID